MSATTTTTTTKADAAKGESSSSTAADSMVDSGFCGSLRLSLQGSMTTSSAEPATAAGAAVPGAAAPDAQKEAGTRQDLCRDLGRMSLEQVPDGAQGPEAGQPEASSLRDDAWREYFEPDDDGDVQLHLAIASGYADVAFALIRMAPHPDYLSLQNNAAYAPLHIAVLQDQPAVVRRLVLAGARLDVRDAEGNTPLHLAARRGNLECAEALLKPASVQEIREAGLPPSVYSRLPAEVVDMRNHAGEHCVHLAAMGGHVDFLRFLCWNNADMNAADGRAGRSALHFAVGAGAAAVVQVLTEPRPRGCGADASQPDWYGRTPCQLALAAGASREMADFLARAMTGDAGASAAVLFPLEAAMAQASSDTSSDSEAERSAALLLNSSA